MPIDFSDLISKLKASSNLRINGNLTTFDPRNCSIKYPNMWYNYYLGSYKDSGYYSAYHKFYIKRSIILVLFDEKYKFIIQT